MAENENVIQPAKVFVYDVNTGVELESRNYVDLLDVQQEVLQHNNNNPDNRKNIYPGTEFPPVGYKFNSELKEFVKKTLQEQVDDGEITLNPTQKILNGEVVVKTLYEQYVEGILILPEDEEVAEEDPHRIAKLSMKGRYEKGLDDSSVVYNEFLGRLNLLFHKEMESVTKYDTFEVNGWYEKKIVSTEWLKVSAEDKMSDENKVLYRILMLESGINDSMTDAEKIEKVDARANKILEKAEQYETKYGSCLNIKNTKQDELKALSEQFASEEDRSTHWQQLQNVIDNIEWTS